MIHWVYVVYTAYTFCTLGIRPVQVYTSCTKFGVYIGPYITDDTLCILGVNGIYTLYIGYTWCTRLIRFVHCVYLVYTAYTLCTLGIRPVQVVYFVYKICCIHWTIYNR